MQTSHISTLIRLHERINISRLTAVYGICMQRQKYSHRNPLKGAEPPCSSGHEMTCCYISRLVELRYTSQWRCYSPQGASVSSPHWLVKTLNNLQIETQPDCLVFPSSMWYRACPKYTFFLSRLERLFKWVVVYSHLFPWGVALHELHFCYKEHKVWLLFLLHISNLEVTL